MSAKRILKSVGKVEKLIGSLDSDIATTADKNSRLLLSIDNLMRLATQIIETIDGWFRLLEDNKAQKVIENEDAIEKGQRLKANLEKLFE